MNKKALKILYISPEPIKHNFSGSSNRIFQTYNLLKNNFTNIKYFSIGPNKNCDINTNFPKDMIANNKIKMPSNYDIYFINYVFLYEQLTIPKNKKVYIDIHDDVIDRNKKLGSNWITRDYYSLKTIINDNVTFLHISNFERKIYDKLFPKNDNINLSFLNSKRQTQSLKIKKQFEFGFVGTQNFVNANSVIKIAEFSKKIELNKKFLLLGKIVNGIKNPPKNFNLLQQVTNIAEFYQSIKYLIVPNHFQTGVSTKIIESLHHNCPVLTTSSMTKMLKLNLYDNQINNVDDLVLYYKNLNYDIEYKKQMNAFKNYKIIVKKEEKNIINHINNSSM